MTQIAILLTRSQHQLAEDPCSVHVEMLLPDECDVEALLDEASVLESPFLDGVGYHVLSVLCVNYLAAGMELRMAPSLEAPLPGWPATIANAEAMTVPLRRLVALSASIGGSMGPYPVMIWCWQAGDEQAIEDIATFEAEPGNRSVWMRLVRRGVMMMTLDPLGLSVAGACASVARAQAVIERVLIEQGAAFDRLEAP